MRWQQLPGLARFLAVFTFAAALAIYAAAPAPVATMVDPDERGTRLIVYGRVFDPTGSRAVAGVTVYAYQTDATGRYNTPGREEPRLRGWATTDREGRFELRTIRPAPYPGRREPAHIHLQLSGASYPRQWAHDIQFSDDAYITTALRRSSDEQGMFGWILSPVRGRDGVLRAKINIRLQTKGN